MTPSIDTTNIKGHQYWQLVFDYDNSDNQGTITHKFTSSVHTSFNKREFEESINKVVNNNKIGVNVSAEAKKSIKLVEAKVSKSLEISNELNLTFENSTKTEKEYSVSRQETIEREYNVGPKSRLLLYQLTFDAPGVSIARDVYKAFPRPPSESELNKDVDIKVTFKVNEFIYTMTAEYADSEGYMTPHRVREVNGKSDNTNYGFGGKYVSLVPLYTQNPSLAASRFDAVVQPNNLGSYDLAARAGGDYRHLVSVKDPRDHMKIVEVALYRSDNRVDIRSVAKSLGYTDGSSDINRGRGGTYLHLLWKSVYVDF